MIENRDTVLLMFWQKVKMSCTRCLVDIIGLPYSIFQLYDHVPNHQREGDISFNIHLVPDPDKYLTIFDLFLTQFFDNFSNTNDISLPVNVILSGS